jgi:hypothetical protein
VKQNGNLPRGIIAKAENPEDNETFVFDTLGLLWIVGKYMSTTVD